jgi:hypothetical protein
LRFLVKSLITGTGLVLVLFGVIALFLATQLNSSVKSGIERSLSHIYQAEVRVDGVAFVLSQGALDLEGVTIFNPEPFKEGPAVEIGHVHLEFVPSTLVSRTPVIRNVTLHDALVHVRLETGHGTNLGRLDANASRLSGGSVAGAPAAARRKFVIREFRSDAARVEFSSNILPVTSVGMDVQPFTMSELSSTKSVSTIDVCILFVRNVLQEGISLKGVLGPVADRLRAEFGRGDGPIEGAGDGDSTVAPSE